MIGRRLGLDPGRDEGVTLMFFRVCAAAFMLVAMLSMGVVANELLPQPIATRLMGACEVMADEANPTVRVERLFGRQGNCAVTSEKEGAVDDISLMAYIIRLRGTQYNWWLSDGLVATKDDAGMPRFLSNDEVAQLVEQMWVARKHAQSDNQQNQSNESGNCAMPTPNNVMVGRSNRRSTIVDTVGRWLNTNRPGVGSQQMQVQVNNHNGQPSDTEVNVIQNQNGSAAASNTVPTHPWMLTTWGEIYEVLPNGDVRLIYPRP